MRAAGVAAAARDRECSSSPLQVEREYGTAVHCASRVLHQLTRHRARVDDRIAPVVELDHLGQKPGTQPVPVASDAVDGDALRRHHAALATAAETVQRCSWTWSEKSSANTCSADRIMITAPSGCRHAPRPGSRPAQRCTCARSSLFARIVAMRCIAVAMARRPKVHGPHCRELSSARYVAMRDDICTPQSLDARTPMTPEPSDRPRFDSTPESSGSPHARPAGIQLPK